VESAAAAGVATAWFATAAEAAEFAGGELRAGDLLLVKGSRGVGLELVVDHVLRRS
jgi:UDP-N-acetylmuramyl pentapeptide synthase